MAMQENSRPIPAVAQDYIDGVVKKMRYRRKVRAEVRAELEAHFEDALADCHDPADRENVAKELIAGFGEAHVLAKLIRRAKKRCRPLWAKVMVRTAQAMGLFVLYVLLCISRLCIGHPTIKTDMIAHLNDEVQAGRDESTNAYPGIRKATASMEPLPTLITKNPTYGDMNDVARQCFDDFLVRHKSALDELAVAVNKPYYWRQYDPAPTGAGDTGFGIQSMSGAIKTQMMTSHLVDQIMPELPHYRWLAFALKYRIQQHCAQGRAEAAVDDTLTLIRFGRRVTQAGALVEQLVGVAITSMGVDAALGVVHDVDVDESLLTRTYTTLADSFDWERPWMNFAVEKAIVDNMIQRGFTDDGHGNGRPLASGVLLLGSSPEGWWKGLLLLDYPDRKQVVEHIDSFFQDLDRWQTMTPWQRRDNPYRLSNTEISTLYTTLTKPALERVGDLAWRAKVGYQALLTVLAIKRYQARHGRLPESLDALVAEGLMKEPPRDFYGPGPLTYMRTSDTEFLLYSWGEDLKDDGGKPSTDQDGKSQKYGPHGDWVFWPRQP